MTRGRFDRLSRDTQNFADRFGTRDTEDALFQATFGRGPLANRTGDPFKDDPFFNPWAKGGAFDQPLRPRDTSVRRNSDYPDSYAPHRTSHSNNFAHAIVHGTDSSPPDLPTPSPPAAKPAARIEKGYNISAAVTAANRSIKEQIDASASKAMTEIKKGFNESRRKLGLPVPAIKPITPPRAYSRDERLLANYRIHDYS